MSMMLPGNIKSRLSVFLLLLCGLAASGQTVVTEKEAVAVSSNFMQHFFREKSFQAVEVTQVRCLERNGHPLLYEVCYRNGCSALVAGVKSVMPVLACRTEGGSDSFLQNSGENGLSYFVEKFASKMESLIENHFDTIDDQWKTLLDGDMPALRGREVYGPYITTRWKQTSSNDGQPDAYNYYVSKKCDRENRCAAGCVPVAMAQIMNYWQHPANRPNKKEKYDWSNMPDELRLYRLNGSQTDTNFNYETERNAIARLLADCGSAASVVYCISECQSFAWPQDARYALVSKFGYRSEAKLIVRNLQESTWKSSIRSNIMEGKPVFYAAVDEMMKLEGHAFVCDGYDTETDLFHFNWGWGGAGAWVTLDEISSGADEWNNLERAVVDIVPDGKQGSPVLASSVGVLKVWPNPVSGRLHIEMPEEEGLVQVIVRDLLGRTVLQNENLSGQELEVSSLPAGMYLLRLRTNEGKILIAKFVKE